MYFAVDIGGTNIRIALAQSLDTPTFTAITKFQVENDYSRDMQVIARAIHDMRQGQPIHGIGCCFAGPISTAKDIILGSPNVPDWIGKPFVHDLSRAFSCDVLLENDAACAALGEATYGQGRNRDFLFLIWGTGFGGTVVTQTEDGIQVRPMEAGHTILDWNSTRICGCGQAGCAEAYLGGVNIRKYLGKSAEILTEEEWEAVYGQMAHAIINVLATNYKPLIIFGGGIACHQKDRFAHIENTLQQRFKIYPMPTLQITEHDDNIGLLGCLALFARSAPATEPAAVAKTQSTQNKRLPSWFSRNRDPSAGPRSSPDRRK